MKIYVSGVRPIVREKGDLERTFSTAIETEKSVLVSYDAIERLTPLALALYVHMQRSDLIRDISMFAGVLGVENKVAKGVLFELIEKGFVIEDVW